MLFIIIILASCKSTPARRAEQQDMYVIVYDYEGSVIQGVSIYIDGNKIGETDIQGRYFLHLPSGKEYLVRVEKSGHETSERKFIFDPLYMLYFQIGNVSQLLQLAEGEIDKGLYTAALGYLDRALSIGENRVDSMYLKSIIYYKQGYFEEALTILDELEARISDREYIKKFRDKIIGQIKK
jgi:tetratricopeptide (TPR) repeat protein